MIISANPAPHYQEFDSLLQSTINELNLQAKHSAKNIASLTGSKLEPYIKDIIAEQASGTVFENSIELVSGQKFPDIIAKKYYGVEVKSTTQNHWKTTGNSVLESSRVEDVERIFMLFGKLGAPIEFKYRPYEHCLSEVVVTHSPRYLVDMNLAAGATIFDKIKMSYNDLRTQPNPIRSIVEYYRGLLKPGEDVWWMGDNHNTSNFIIKVWGNLPKEEKEQLIVKGMAYFPELFSNSSDKFGRFAIWLVTSQGIVCPNVRDLFTAGGKVDLKIGKRTYKNVPRIIDSLVPRIPQIIETIGNTSSIELSGHWKEKTDDKNKVNHWISIVAEEAKKLSNVKHMDVKEIINKVIVSQ